MKTRLTKIALLFRDHRAMALLGMLVVANFICSGWLLRHRAYGFYAPHGDEVARAIVSYGLKSGWEIPPDSIFSHWKVTGLFPHRVWPPLQFYVQALLLYLTGDLLLTPFLANSIFSAGIIVAVYLLVGMFSESRPWLPLAGAVLYASLPGFKLIDLSGLDQTVLNCFMIYGLFFWLRFRREARRSHLYLSAACFMLASAVRFEGWFVVAIFGGFCIGALIRRPERPIRNALLGAICLSMVFIAIWLVHQMVTYRELYFLNYHREEALLGRDKLYLDQDLWTKVTFFPRLLLDASPLLVIFSLLAALQAKRLPASVRRYAAFIAAEFILLLLSVLYVGVPHGSQRVVMTNLLLLLPLAVTGLWSLGRGLVGEKKGLVLSVAVIAVYSGFQAAAVQNSLANGISREVFQVGYLMREAVERGALNQADRIYIEYTGRQPWGVWDTQRISLFAPRQAVVKLPFSLASAAPDAELRKKMERERFVMAVVWSPEARQRLQPLMEELFRTEHYAVYAIPCLNERLSGWEERLRERGLDPLNLMNDAG